MPKYMVVIKEVHESYRVVQAESKDGAKEAALADVSAEVDLQYYRTLDEFDDIDVREIKECQE